jgi:hypothetical protein
MIPRRAVPVTVALLLVSLVVSGCSIPTWMPLIGKSKAARPAAEPGVQPSASAPILTSRDQLPSSEDVVDRVICVVNNDAITQYELDEAELYYLAETRERPSDGEARKALRARLLQHRHARSAIRGIRKRLDPEADIRRHKKMHKLSGSVDAARHLAGELVASGRFDEAIRHYEEALKGLYEHDPDLLLGLAQAQFGHGEFSKAQATLNTLIEHNPDFRSQDGHLIYARSAEECGDLEKAEEEYKAVATYYSGAEAEIRYARLLEKVGKASEALPVYQDVVTAAELAPRHYRKAQKAWIAEAREGIKRLGTG